MLDMILSLFTGGGGGYIAAIVAAVVGFIGLYAKGRSDGKAKAENKALKNTIAAKNAQLEMNREATKIEREVVGLDDQAARKEAEKWSRRSQ